MKFESKYEIFAWGHQAITWPNLVWSSVRSSENHLRAISQKISRPSVTNISLKIIYLKFLSNLQRVDDGLYNLLHSPCIYVYIIDKTILQTKQM